MRCTCEVVTIPAGAIQQAVRNGADACQRFHVFAFEHTPRRWQIWCSFKTRREAKAWCRGTFPASCGVRVVQTDEHGKVWDIENVFPSATKVCFRFPELMPSWLANDRP